MNREEIIAMAQESGMKASIGRTIKEKGKADVYRPDVNALSKSVPVEWLERFAALVAAKELEECILEMKMHTPRDGHDSPGWVRMNRMIDAIRARGQQ